MQGVATCKMKRNALDFCDWDTTQSPNRVPLTIHVCVRYLFSNLNKSKSCLNSINGTPK